MDGTELPFKTSTEGGYKKELDGAHCFCQGHCSLWCTVSIPFFSIIYSCDPFVNIYDTETKTGTIVICFHSLLEILKVILAQH